MNSTIAGWALLITVTVFAVVAVAALLIVRRRKDKPVVSQRDYVCAQLACDDTGMVELKAPDGTSTFVSVDALMSNADALKAALAGKSHHALAAVRASSVNRPMKLGGEVSGIQVGDLGVYNGTYIDPETAHQSVSTIPIERDNGNGRRQARTLTDQENSTATTSLEGIEDQLARDQFLLQQQHVKDDADVAPGKTKRLRAKRQEALVTIANQRRSMVGILGGTKRLTQKAGEPLSGIYANTLQQGRVTDIKVPKAFVGEGHFNIPPSVVDSFTSVKNEAEGGVSLQASFKVENARNARPTPFTYELDYDEDGVNLVVAQVMQLIRDGASPTARQISQLRGVQLESMMMRAAAAIERGDLVPVERDGTVVRYRFAKAATASIGPALNAKWATDFEPELRSLWGARFEGMMAGFAQRLYSFGAMQNLAISFTGNERTNAETVAANELLRTVVPLETPAIRVVD